MNTDDLNKLAENIDLTKPLLSARSSQIFDLGDEKILKLYFEEVDELNTDVELLNTSVAFSKGCTPMECFGKVKVQGRNGLVLKKLYGCSLTNLPEKKPLSLFPRGKLLQNCTLKFTRKPRTTCETFALRH